MNVSAIFVFTCTLLFNFSVYRFVPSLSADSTAMISIWVVRNICTFLPNRCVCVVQLLATSVCVQIWIYNADKKKTRETFFAGVRVCRCNVVSNDYNDVAKLVDILCILDGAMRRCGKFGVKFNRDVWLCMVVCDSCQNKNFLECGAIRTTHDACLCLLLFTIL